MSRVANRRVVTPQAAAPQAPQAAPEAPAFDYSAEAELYPSRAKGSRRQPVGYKRFDHASEAIRFAIEELPDEALVGAYLEIGEERFNGQEIQRLYDRPDYPLERRPRPPKSEAPQKSGGVVDTASGAPRKFGERS